MDIRRVLQFITLTLALLSLILVCSRYYYSRYRTTKKLLYTPIIYFGHVVVYYTVVLLSREAVNLDQTLLGFDILPHHGWSAGLTLHSIIALLFIMYAYYRRCMDDA